MIEAPHRQSGILIGGIPLLLALALLPAPPARAEFTLTVVPPYVEKLVKPGSKFGDTLAFRNDGSDPVVVGVDFGDFGVDEHGAVTDSPPGSEARSLIRHLRISPLSQRVEPGQQVYFRYAVEVPEEFQQLRTIVYFRAVPDVEVAANQVLVVARMGVPLYVENVKAAPAKLAVGEVNLTRSEDDPAQLRLRMDLLNEGERNIRPQGMAHVESADGRFRQTFDLNRGREPVLPGQARQWQQLIGPVPDGELTVRLDLATSVRGSFRTESTVPPAGS